LSTTLDTAILHMRHMFLYIWLNMSNLCFEISFSTE
jgi:hypothetical protein